MFIVGIVFSVQHTNREELDNQHSVRAWGTLKGGSIGRHNLPDL